MIQQLYLDSWHAIYSTSPKKTTTYLRGLRIIPIIKNLLPGTGFMEWHKVMEYETARDKSFILHCKPDTRTSRALLLAYLKCQWSHYICNITQINQHNIVCPVIIAAKKFTYDLLVPTVVLKTFFKLLILCIFQTTTFLSKI